MACYVIFKTIPVLKTCGLFEIHFFSVFTFVFLITVAVKLLKLCLASWCITNI